MEDSFMDILIPLLTFVFIVGGSIVKSFTENKDDKDNQAPKNRPTRSTRPTGQSVNPERQTRFERFEIDESQQKDQKNEQLKQLKKDLSISTEASVATQETNRDLGKTLKSKSQTRTISRKEMGIEKYFTEKGLAGSVVMSEVLGKPRSKKPYRPYNR